MKTIQLEDLFGTVSFGNKMNASKYTYPNTVPQAKIATIKTYADVEADMNNESAAFKQHAFSSANLNKSKRRYNNESSAT